MILLQRDTVMIDKWLLIVLTVTSSTSQQIDLSMLEDLAEIPINLDSLDQLVVYSHKKFNKENNIDLLDELIAVSDISGT